MDFAAPVRNHGSVLSWRGRGQNNGWNALKHKLGRDVCVERDLEMNSCVDFDLLGTRNGQRGFYISPREKLIEIRCPPLPPSDPSISPGAECQHKPGSLIWSQLGSAFDVTFSTPKGMSLVATVTSGPDKPWGDGQPLPPAPLPEATEWHLPVNHWRTGESLTKMMADLYVMSFTGKGGGGKTER